MAIEHPLADRHEEAPDEDVLLASGDLDVRFQNALRSAPVDSQNFAERLTFQSVVVDVEVKVGIAAEVARNGLVEGEVSQAVEESGVRIELEVAGSVSDRDRFPK